jgi:glycosyltransferase-like protein
MTRTLASNVPVVLVTYSTKPRGGVVHTLELAEALHRQGEPVSIVALGDPEQGFFRTTTVPHTIFPAPAPAPTLEERVADSVDALVLVLSALVRNTCILHTQDCIAARAATQVRDGGAPAVVLRTVHHVDDFTTPALVDCQRRAIVEPDHLLVVSEYWQRVLRSDFGVEAAIVTNGVDIPRFAKLPVIESTALRERMGLADRFVFLTVGGIEPRKGSAFLIEAMGRLRNGSGRPPALVVVGGHSFQDHAAYRQNVLDRAAALGIELGSELLILGTVSDDELASWYHTADAFVFPSVKEGWGLAVLEAQVAGAPVICTDIPVFREYLTNNTAMLVPSGDAASLEKAMRLLMHSPELRRRLGAAGRHAATRYSWDACATRHRAIYDKIEQPRSVGVA